ncbi:RtcB family protein [Streptomonospora nanhaiensis]|uniref:3'-phosphate/5'-hydroxy nucleic acid ligase n=1 Tax=Streptomonospora nanhaiensis TaxID=1323731 RepID=A0A853BJ60_9ACTN|nr:RtcB family protein [Streptomonospora nanhaiensis]MBV2366165.1 RtcB family protein [Streptomonospora nanhaiensis]MBX9390505.1 RtcB family protein [Streptomonospora nanhaiensis]NYI94631.1 tRNA-splicing ligase RtcB [Streptomonospora nanhaiensis]
MPYTEVPGARVPIRMWADPDTVEPAAMDQLRNVTRLPWVHGLAVMPDVHYGKGATVGSVIAMRDAVSPAAVGVDIGCGMTAVRSTLTAADLPDDLARLRSRLEAAIPVGYHAHERPVDPRRVHGLRTSGWDDFWARFDSLARPVHDRRERAARQLGTLGGGNHFLEVCLDDDQKVWLVLHSGSRNIGKELAEHHIERARRLPHNQDLPDRDLAVFVAGTPEMDDYRRDLFWAQEYARRNRDIMMGLACDVLRATVPGVRFEQWISCHHNYVAEEEYDGVRVLVTRKGAIRAGAGDYGIIPGSMATGTYIVRGLGNPAAFNSASHGAGRRMSRNKAKRRFTEADLVEQTKGVECRKDAGVLDEIPAAYKDISAVVEAQTDLVEVVAHLRQVVCVKG